MTRWRGTTGSADWTVLEGDRSHATIVARHYLSRLVVRLHCQHGVITGIQPLVDDLPVDHWIAPGLLDVQINGFAGVDFQARELTREDLHHAVRGLRKAGCLRFLAVIMTDRWETMLARLRRLRTLRSDSPVLQRAIAGWHVEGPFLSPRPGFHGAHEADCMIDPKPRHIRELRATAGKDLVLLTLAPEREGAIEAIALATSLGMRVSLGHTDASSDTIQRALTAGATGFTHLGNGCPQALDRHDNNLWRVFEAGLPMVSLIPDGVHVSPALFRLAHRLLPAEGVIYTSDAMAAAGSAPGTYGLGRMRLTVGADQVVRMPGQPYLAGSALRPVDGVWRAATMTEGSWQTCWRRFSQLPADWLGIPWGLSVGAPADFCLMPVDDEGNPRGLRVFVNGVEALG